MSVAGEGRITKAGTGATDTTFGALAMGCAKAPRSLVPQPARSALFAQLIVPWMVGRPRGLAPFA